MRNTLGDLNNHLFMQLEKLSEDDLKGEELREEIIRTKAIGESAKHIIDNANVVLQAQKLKNNAIDIYYISTKHQVRLYRFPFFQQR